MSMKIHFQTAEGPRSPPMWLTRLVLPTAHAKKRSEETGAVSSVELFLTVTCDVGSVRPYVYIALPWTTSDFFQVNLIVWLI